MTTAPIGALPLLQCYAKKRTIIVIVLSFFWKAKNVYTIPVISL